MLTMKNSCRVEKKGRSMNSFPICYKIFLGVMEGLLKLELFIPFLDNYKNIIGPVSLTIVSLSIRHFLAVG